MAVENPHIQKFLFENTPVRGVAVRLGAAWQEIVQRKANSSTGAYSETVQTILGEMTAAAVLMQAHIKLDGALTMQMQGLGALQMAVTEVQSNLGVRATASLAQDTDITAHTHFADLVAADSHARCAITFAAHNAQHTYQGIVPLHDANGSPAQSISQALQNYMQQSEQLPTTFMLAANADTAAGILLQRMPSADHDAAAQAQYEHLSILARSMKAQELLSLDIATVLHRLFWNEALLHIAPQADDPSPHFACTCTHARVANMLRSLGQAEVDDMLNAQETITIDCTFCGKSYGFDAIDAQQLFVQTQQQPNTSTRKQ